MDQSTSALNEKKSVADIERDIHQTQQEMSRTIDSIQYRLSPEYLKSRVRDEMKQMEYRAKETVKDKSRGMMDRIKENPAAAVIAGTGLFMLFRGNSKSDSHGDYEAYGSYEADYGYVMICDACDIPVHEHEGQNHGFIERARDRMHGAGSKAKGKVSDLKHSASDAADSVGEKADDAKEWVGEKADDAREWVQESAGRVSQGAQNVSRRAGQQARRTGRQAQQRFEQDPLLMGAIGIAAGALLGAMIPESDKERELMGDARDQFVDRGKQFAKEKGKQVGRIVEQAKDAAVEEAKDEAKRQDLTGKSSDEPGHARPTI